MANELDDHWYILRRREIKDRLSNVFGGFEFGQGAALAQMGKGPKLSQALETYLSLKSAGRPNTFEGGARRSVGYIETKCVSYGHFILSNQKCSGEVYITILNNAQISDC